MRGLGLGLGLRRGGTPVNANAVLVASLMAEATILGNTFARAGNQWNPDTQANVGANLKVSRSVVMGGVSVPLILTERGGANLATTASATTTATSTGTTTKTVWWDGGASDYTVTVNGSGIVGAKQTTTDQVGTVRNYVTITGMANGDIITCTRGGGATNTHLQIEEVDSPTSKIALSGTRTQVQYKQTGMSPGDNGTIVALFQPYGWTGEIAGAQRYYLCRVSTGAQNANLFLSGINSTTLRYQRAYNGGTIARDQRWAPKHGQNRLVAASWSLADVNSVRVSGRETAGTDGFTDALGSGVASAAPGVTPIAVWSSLDIGSWYTATAQTQCNGWLALLYFARVLSQNEVDQLALAFEGLSGFAPEINGWGDSFFAYNTPATRPVDYVIQNLRPTWRTFNGGVGGETVAQIMARFLAHPRKWRGFSVFDTQNSQDLANLQAMVALLGHSRYIVCSQHNDSVTAQSGSANYNSVIAYNATLAAAFGANYWDWRTYLIGFNNGTTDVADTAHDCVGTSLRGDSLHPNQAGFAQLGIGLDAKITSLGISYP